MIKITPLGAGQHVGKSAILAEFTSMNIKVLLDCGLQIGVNESKRYPDFSIITDSEGRIELDAVLVTHFHLDHVGSLPYLTEVLNYKGPVVMTDPTKAIALPLLKDNMQLSKTRFNEGQSVSISSEMVHSCFSKVTTLDLHSTIEITKGLFVTAYYAGHVLGAVMYHVVCGNQSLVYTGDYNMTPDRHLGAAWISQCKPDVLITESTFSTTIRESKRTREKEFLDKILRCVSNGGKVLIPVFALGRAQELCILIEALWDKMQLTYPIYFSGALLEKSTEYYKMFMAWTNQRIKKTLGATKQASHHTLSGNYANDSTKNIFDFQYIKPFERSYALQEGPMVLFATPGMLTAGFSLEIFSLWAPDPRNMVIMPGFCNHGTVGFQVLHGDKHVNIYGQMVPIRLSVEHMSFSAHTDAIGILQLIQLVTPKHILLVHGDALKMPFLAHKIKKHFDLDCYYPKNGETISFSTTPTVDVCIPTTYFTNRTHLLNKALHDLVSDPNNTLYKDAIESYLHTNKQEIISMGRVGMVNENKDLYKVDILPNDRQFSTKERPGNEIPMEESMMIAGLATFKYIINHSISIKSPVAWNTLRDLLSSIKTIELYTVNNIDIHEKETMLIINRVKIEYICGVNILVSHCYLDLPFAAHLCSKIKLIVGN